MMKPKVLPGLAGGYSRFGLVLRMVFFLPTRMWELGEGCGWKWQGLVWPCVTPSGSLLGHCHPGEAAPSITTRMLEGTRPPVLVWQGHPAPTAHSRGWQSTGAFLCLHPALTLLSCTIGADEEMADVLQDVGLRSVSTGLMVLRRCWGNSAVPNRRLCCGSCNSAQEASGDTGQAPAAWRRVGAWLETGTCAGSLEGLCTPMGGSRRSGVHGRAEL